MVEVKHTPGPWHVKGVFYDQTIVIANVDGETFADGTSSYTYDFVCDTLCDGEDDSRSSAVAVANARLIAAAPDMLAALVELRDWYTEFTGLPAVAANAAIAKAEGK